MQLNIDMNIVYALDIWTLSVYAILNMAKPSNTIFKIQS